MSNIKKVLFVGESNLGKEGYALVREFYPDAECVMWDPGESKEKAREFIRTQGPWDLTCSFYCNLVFEVADLDCMALPLNFHPSSPKVPGVGYDTIPLVDGHEKNAATAHFMNSEIDKGPIFRVCEQRIPEDATYLELRESNQQLVLQVMRETLEIIAEQEALEAERSKLAVRLKLTASAKELGVDWGDTYYSYKEIKRILSELYQQDPEHPVFVGNQVFKKSLKTTSKTAIQS